MHYYLSSMSDRLNYDQRCSNSADEYLRSTDNKILIEATNDEIVGWLMEQYDYEMSEIDPDVDDVDEARARAESAYFIEVSEYMSYLRPRTVTIQVVLLISDTGSRYWRIEDMAQGYTGNYDQTDVVARSIQLDILVPSEEQLNDSDIDPDDFIFDEVIENQGVLETVRGEWQLPPPRNFTLYENGTWEWSLPDLPKVEKPT